MNLAFENEDFVPAVPPEGAPDFSYVEGVDPGGYIFYGTYGYNLYAPKGGPTEDDMPYCPHKGLLTAWMLVVFYGFPSAPGPEQFWNCTEKGYGLYKSEDFLGELNAIRICAFGECCEGTIGGAKFADDAMNWHTTVGDRFKGGLCEIKDLEEEVYCLEIMGQANCNCYEYYPEIDVMSHSIPCVDNAVRFMINCKVFKTKLSLRWVEGAVEPLSYMGSMTTEEIIGWDSVVIYNELRLCKPYSYYHPEAAPTSGSEAKMVDSASNLFVGTGVFLLSALI